MDLKLLIADGTEDFRIALADSLRGIYQVRQCADGQEALAMLHSFKPDVLVLDLMLPGMDGISLLQSAAAAGLQPMVLATTRFHNDYVVDSAELLGVGYLMVKPCDVRATVARIRDLSQRIHPPLVSQPDPKILASNILLGLGIPTKLRGYLYLREALPIIAGKPGLSITKELYPAVAKRCGCEKEHVERSIRSAIETAWAKRDDRIWSMYFPADASGKYRRPTNGTFITRLADALEQGCRG